MLNKIEERSQRYRKRELAEGYQKFVEGGEGADDRWYGKKMAEKTEGTRSVHDTKRKTE